MPGRAPRDTPPASKPDDFRTSLREHQPRPRRPERPRRRELQAPDVQRRRERSRRRTPEAQVRGPEGHVRARAAAHAERRDAAGERAGRVAEADARVARVREDRRGGDRRVEELAARVRERQPRRFAPGVRAG